MRVAAVIALMLGLALAACGGKPLDPSKWQGSASDIPPGPGLFSGDDGEEQGTDEDEPSQ